MIHHVVTARIYTGGLFFLCLAASGKIGGWCTDVKQALIFNNPGEADRLFEGFCIYLQCPTKRGTFDPDMLVSIRKVARLIELGAGHMEDESVKGIVYRRHRVLDISPPGAYTCPVLKLSNAA